MFDYSFGQVGEGFLLTPVRTSFHEFYIWEGLGEGSEVGIVESVADGVTAVTEKDANVH